MGEGVIPDFKWPQWTPGNKRKMEDLMDEYPEVRIFFDIQNDPGRPMTIEFNFDGPDSLVTDFGLKLKVIDFDNGNGGAEA